MSDNTQKPMTSISQSMEHKRSVLENDRHIKSSIGSQPKHVTSSIGRIGQTDSVATSIYRPIDQTNERYDEGADTRRYSYIRKLVKERQAQERVEKKEIEASEKNTGVGKFSKKTGARFSVFHFKKAIRNMIVRNPAQYKNISKVDKNFFTDLVVRHAKNAPTGSGFSRKTRLEMKSEIEKKWKSGDITRDDANDFKKLVDELKG